MARFVEQRDAVRREVFGGNAELRALRGSGLCEVADRARIVNWSQGGLLLKVPSPQRRLLLFRREPCLAVGEVVSMVLRLPPAYREIEVEGVVVHARRTARAPDTLRVGIEFDEESHGFSKSLAAMIALLEPRKRSSRHARQRSA